tara:strand:- start:1314 stop:1688 length:375 start_codon:yes stop_codon:yes gene_type:complete
MLRLAALFLVLQPFSGLFAMSHPVATSVQWMSVCTLQGTQQIKMRLPRADDMPDTSETAVWTCPDCVSTPPAGAPVVAADIFSPSAFLAALEGSQSPSSHLICVAGPAFPARAPPPVVNLDAQP